MKEEESHLTGNKAYARIEGRGSFVRLVIIVSGRVKMHQNDMAEEKCWKLHFEGVATLWSKFTRENIISNFVPR